MRILDDRRTAIAIGHLARIAAKTGEVERAAQLLGYNDAFYRGWGNARGRIEQDGYDRTVALLGDALPADRLRELMDRGEAMPSHAAVAEALAVREPAAALTG